MDLRRYLISRLPQQADLETHRWLRRFGSSLGDPKLWHFGRRQVARSTATGLFVALIPIPVHLPILLGLAFLRRLNLPVVMTVVWITNPVTWVPIFYFAYRVGLLVTGQPPQSLESLHLGAEPGAWQHALASLWLPLGLGSLVCALVVSVLARLTIDLLWRLSIRRRRRQRALLREAQLTA